MASTEIQTESLAAPTPVINIWKTVIPDTCDFNAWARSFLRPFDSSAYGLKEWQLKQLRKHQLKLINSKRPRTLFPPRTLSTRGVLATFPLFEVKPSPKGGYGCFATQDIMSYTDILIEQPFLKCTLGEFPKLYPTLPASTKSEILKLSYWPGADKDHATAIFKTNRFEIQGQCALLRTASRFNHACYPNITYSWSYQREAFVFSTKMFVEKGMELTVSYGHASQDLKELYGFECDCCECWAPPIWEGEVESVVKKAKRAKMMEGLEGVEEEVDGNVNAEVVADRYHFFLCILNRGLDA